MWPVHPTITASYRSQIVEVADRFSIYVNAFLRVTAIA